MRCLARTIYLFIAIFSGVTGACVSLADPIEDFYKNKQMRLIVGTTPGGGFDSYGRLFAVHVPRHIPGNPPVVTSNMPGASGMKSVAYLFNVAPRDGTTIATFNQSMGQRQMLEPEAASQFDVNQLTWLGAISSSVSILMTYHTSGVKSLADAKKREVVIGALSNSGGNYIYPTLLNHFLGTRFKVVVGYEGGQSILLAMERGEVDGRGSTEWVSFQSAWSHWIADKKVNILVQVGLAKDPGLPDVPLLIDLANTAEQASLFRLVSSDANMGFPIAAPPELPKERAAALRNAFEATMADPLFLAEAQKRGLPVRPSSGAEVQKVIEGIVSTPKEAVSLLKQILAEPTVSTSTK